jgi:hypothetical protein
MPLTGAAKALVFLQIIFKKLKFFSSPADNDSDYFIIAKYACLP